MYRSQLEWGLGGGIRNQAVDIYFLIVTRGHLAELAVEIMFTGNNAA